MTKTKASPKNVVVEASKGGQWVIRVDGKAKGRFASRDRALEEAVSLSGGAAVGIVLGSGKSAGKGTYIEKAGSKAKHWRERRELAVKSVEGTYPQRIDSARAVLGSDAQVAEALGVARSQVKRWGEGTTKPTDLNADRVIALDTVVALLSGHLEPESITKWLNGINAHLGNRTPVELLREGNLSDVVAAIEALKAGSYA